MPARAPVSTETGARRDFFDGMADQGHSIFLAVGFLLHRLGRGMPMPRIARQSLIESSLSGHGVRLSF